MAHVLPEEFSDLEPYADWAIPTEKARYDKRVETSMADMEAFYNAAFERFDDALAYLEKYEVDDLPEEGQRLLWLYCALVTVSFPIEVWRQPRVPDSGASTFDAILEPAI